MTGTTETEAKTSSPGRREERRRQLQELGRTQLLDAAEEVFARKGFHDATLREIGELAEFSVGSVYTFFDSKEDLFESVLLRRGDQLLPLIRAVVEGEEPPLAQLHTLVDAEVGFFRDHPGFGRLYLRTSSHTILSAEAAADPESAVHGRFREAMDLQASVFSRGQATGELRDGDPHVLATLFTGMISAYQASDPAVVSDDPDAAELLPLDALHAMIERAFTAPGSSGRGHGRR